MHRVVYFRKTVYTESKGEVPSVTGGTAVALLRVRTLSGATPSVKGKPAQKPHIV